MTLAKRRNFRRVGFENCPIPWKELIMLATFKLSVSWHIVLKLVLRLEMLPTDNDPSNLVTQVIVCQLLESANFFTMCVYECLSICVDMCMNIYAYVGGMCIYKSITLECNYDLPFVLLIKTLVAVLQQSLRCRTLGQYNIEVH